MYMNEVPHPLGTRAKRGGVYMSTPVHPTLWSADDLDRRLRDRIRDAETRRADRAALRQQLDQRRTAGLERRHQTKLRRNKTVATKTINAAPEPRKIRCRMTDRYGNPCTGESLGGELADVHICMRHAALVLELVRTAGLPTAAPTTRSRS